MPQLRWPQAHSRISRVNPLLQQNAYSDSPCTCRRCFSSDGRRPMHNLRGRTRAYNNSHAFKKNHVRYRDTDTDTSIPQSNGAQCGILQFKSDGSSRQPLYTPHLPIGQLTYLRHSPDHPSLVRWPDSHTFAKGLP